MTKASDPRSLVGKRFKITKIVDRYPNFLLDPTRNLSAIPYQEDRPRTNFEGTVTSATEDEVWFKLDEHLDSLDEWDNSIHWQTYPDERGPEMPPSAIEQFLDETEAL